MIHVSSHCVVILTLRGKLLSFSLSLLFPVCLCISFVTLVVAVILLGSMFLVAAICLFLNFLSYQVRLLKSQAIVSVKHQGVNGSKQVELK